MILDRNIPGDAVLSFARFIVTSSVLLLLAVRPGAPSK